MGSNKRKGDDRTARMKEGGRPPATIMKTTQYFAIHKFQTGYIWAESIVLMEARNITL